MLYCMSRRAASILLSPEERATCDLGAYIFNWTSAGPFMSITASDAANSALGVISLREAKGEYLFVVNNEIVKPGPVKLEVATDGAWTITITKAEASAAVVLPQTLSGAEMKSTVPCPSHSMPTLAASK